MTKRAVAGSEMALGRNHHLTFMNTHTLGKILKLRGQYNEAAEQCRRALGRFIKVVGPGNRGTLRCLQSLALIEECQGRYAEAETLLIKVVEGNVTALGQDHHETWNSEKDLERVSRVREMK